MVYCFNAFKVATKEDLLSLKSEINEKVYSSTLRYGEGFPNSRGGMFEKGCTRISSVFTCVRAWNQYFIKRTPWTSSRRSPVIFVSVVLRFGWVFPSDTGGLFREGILPKSVMLAALFVVFWYVTALGNMRVLRVKTAFSTDNRCVPLDFPFFFP